MADGKSVEDLLKEAVRVDRGPDRQPEQKKTGDLISSSVIRGAAGLAGMPSDLMGLLGRGVEWGARKLGVNVPPGSFEPELPLGSQNIISGIERATGTPLYKPEGGLSGYVTSGIEGATAGAPGGVPGMILGALAGLGGQAAADVFGEGALSRVGGGMAAVPLASSFMGRGGAVVGGLRAGAGIAKDVADQQAGPIVNKMVNSQLRQSVAGTPNAAQNITEGLALREKIPGFNPSVAEMSGSKGAAELQRRFAVSSPEALNREVARTEANQAAIQRYYDSIAPSGEKPSAVRSAVNQTLSGELKAQEAQAQSVAGQLPKVDQLGTGERLSALAASEKATAALAIRQAYDAAFDAAGGGKVDITPVVQKVEEILGTKLAQVKPESAPQTVRKIKSLDPELSVSGVSLKDADEIRKAINADIASAGMSLNPMAATQLRNLQQVHSVIDNAVKTSNLPETAKTLYADALNKYRTEYVPRFKEGANLRVFKDTSLNEPRILPDKFVSEFFKPDSQGGITRTLQFTRLFGNNAEAKDLAQKGILDLYRQKVVDPNTGAIKPTSHNEFMRTYVNTLDAFKDNGVNAADQLKRIGSEAIKTDFAGKRLQGLASDLKFDTVDDLVSNALKSPKVMGNVSMRLTPHTKETFTRLVMDRAMQPGTGAGIAKFINENEKALLMVVPERHVSNLKDIAKAYEIAERAPLRGVAEAGGPDVLKNQTGVSAATVYAQIRATTAGRQAPVTAAFNLAAPVLNKLSQTRFVDIMENALHNPETARDLRAFLLANNPAEANAWGQRLIGGMKDAGHILWSAKGPILKHTVGLERYPANAAKAAIPTAAQTLEER